MRVADDVYQVWFSLENGERLAVVQAVQPDGQVRFLGSERFGPFDTERDVAAWVWARLVLAWGGKLG